MLCATVWLWSCCWVDACILILLVPTSNPIEVMWYYCSFANQPLCDNWKAPQVRLLCFVSTVLKKHMHFVLTQMVACQSWEQLVGLGELFLIWRMLWKATLKLDSVLQCPWRSCRKNVPAGSWACRRAWKPFQPLTPPWVICLVGQCILIFSLRAQFVDIHQLRKQEGQYQTQHLP